MTTWRKVRGYLGGVRYEFELVCPLCGAVVGMLESEGLIGRLSSVLCPDCGDAIWFEFSVGREGDLIVSTYTLVPDRTVKIPRGEIRRVAIQVRVRDGHWEIHPGAEEEDWDGVMENVDDVTMVERLAGWHPYTEAYALSRGAELWYYFVGEVEGEIGEEA